jgi:PAS domain S-box-containing protein
MASNMKTKEQVIKELKEEVESLKSENSSLKRLMAETGAGRMNRIKEDEKYRELFENAPMPYQSLNINGEIITVNKAWLEMLGYTKKAVIGMYIGNYLTSGSRKKLLERFPLFVKHGFVEDADFEMITSSGNVVFVIINGRIQPDSQGNFKATHCLLTNVTDKRIAQEELTASELRFRQIIQSSPMGMHMYQLKENNKLEFTGANPAADKILGVDHIQFIGKSIEEAFPGLIFTEVPGRYRDIARNGADWHTEQIDYHEGAIQGAFEVVAFQTEPGKMVTIFNDVTERKRIYHEMLEAKERAEESDQLKSAFLANLSHEIRTPMNAILGFTELLGLQEILPEEKNNYIDIIHKSGKQLLSIISEIIEISQIETGQITLHHTPIDLENLMDNLYQQLCVTIPASKPVELKFLSPPLGDGSRIITDEIKLQQILINLIANAIKYTERGLITVAYEFTDNHEIRFIVQDTGIGIDKKYHQLIFERFRQVEGDTAIRYGGSGLGLAISKAYVGMLGGTISVSSVPGKGSIFVFTIPHQKYFQPDPGVSRVTEAIRNKLSKCGQILIAEDDEYSYLLLSRLFFGTNIHLLRAKNGKEAVTLCRKNLGIALVLMDIKMPVMNGLDAARQIRKANPSLPLVAQTAYALEEDKTQIQQAGFSGYLTKPIEKEKLLDMIESLL